MKAALYVEDSTIEVLSSDGVIFKSCGKGLFSTASYSNKDFVADFEGTIENMTPTTILDGYKVKLNEMLLLDCTFHQTSSMASYANCPKNVRFILSKLEASANSKLIYNTKSKKAQLIATTNIAPNTEIFWHYDPSYIY